MAVAAAIVSALTINSTTDATAFSTASYQTVAGAFYLVGVHGSHGTNAAQPTVTNTWLRTNLTTRTTTPVLLATLQRTGGAFRSSLFGFVGTGELLNGITFDYGATTHLDCVCHVVECIGVATSNFPTNWAQGATTPVVQVVTNQGSGTTGTVTLAAYNDTDNRPVSFWYHNANEGTTPDVTGWSELADSGHATPARAGESQWYSAGTDTTCTATWATSTGWVGIAVEMREGLAEIPMHIGEFRRGTLN
jgi:hypothetical protein